MRRILLVYLFISFALCAAAQSFEVSGISENVKGSIGETVKAPLKFKNLTEKPVTLIIRRLQQQIGSTQKNFFCLDNNCLDEKIEDFVLKLEPGQTISSLQIALEGGLVPGPSSVRYLAFSRSIPTHAVEFEINFTIEERPDKNNIYQSRAITVKDVYPNPSIDHAYVDYVVTSDRTKARLRIHNILGNVVGEYDLSPYETLVRIKTDELNAGIYFYTLYIDNESVMTRKLIVKK
jgi:hypothetical protein